MSTASYDISISADNIWSGDGIYDHTPGEIGSIRDCAAILGGDQESAEAIYSAIEDEISNMAEPADGEITMDGVTYAWTLTAKGDPTGRIALGMRVASDEGGYDEGRVDDVYSDSAKVAWDSGVVTTVPLNGLSPL